MSFKSRFKQSTWTALTIGTVLIGGGLFYIGQGSSDSVQAADQKAAATPPPSVSVVVPGLRHVSSTVKVTGTISARNDMAVGPEGESGRISDIYVEAGQKVARGQVMARLNTDLLKPQVAQLAASLEEARANARLAQADYVRVKSIADTGAISKEEIDRRAAAAETAKARAKVVEAQLHEAQARLARADIRAPASGMVLERMVEVGQVASPGNGVMFRLAKNSDVELRGQVAEQDMPRLAVGQPAIVTITGTNRTFPGKIWLVSPTIDPQSRLGSVRIALKPDTLLRPGAFARASVTAGTATRPVLPQSSILADDKGSFVYIADTGNKVQRRNVTVGAAAQGGLVVLKGLTGNERVVVSAGAFLRTGEKISPVKKNIGDLLKRSGS